MVWRACGQLHLGCALLDWTVATSRLAFYMQVGVGSGPPCIPHAGCPNQMGGRVALSQEARGRARRGMPARMACYEVLGEGVILQVLQWLLFETLRLWEEAVGGGLTKRGTLWVAYFDSSVLSFFLLFFFVFAGWGDLRVSGHV